ncbi:MAG: cobyrinate a,c-diamide synthase [Desulfobacterales bacterium]|nr:cobyrinic acid a,c-diamide synthase [Desulfobacter sp.]MDP6395133.1 cobyrinate a,c-diamide synthase [Desulfobacterales bacterium]MDP6683186.1 cobyrinate a,c-diamide synthase [Desulfobacterales bacterium]MDP6806393.1 cobyrinate a,c-diamide synthase [Desulfobacterales bacterium]
MDFPRIIISALRGGSGKTILSIGIIAAWRRLGKSIAPFKKGPDYIDSGWLSLAADRPCYNLDTFLCSKTRVLQSFSAHTSPEDVAVIEGNRGLFDGIDLEGRTSTAELAKLLNVPVVLSLNCTKATRTVAAVVSGCIHFDPDVTISGVILNHVAGSRHERILRKNIEYYCGIPVLGAVPKLSWQDFPERHMGLVPIFESIWAKDSVDAAAEIAQTHLDLDRIANIGSDPVFKMESSGAGSSENRQKRNLGRQKPKAILQKPKPKIGILKDAAFQFYYPENIDALSLQGGEPIFISPLKSKTIPRIDALYIGGGFPETHAKELAKNVTFKDRLRSWAEDGLPIYAECGGLMYLAQELILDGKSYAMAGVLPIGLGFSKKPEGHGYTVVKVDSKNPYFKVGTEIKGHEFHYSRVLRWDGNDRDMVFSMKRGTGFHNRRDGVCYKNVLATFTHIHALGTPSWARAMVRNAIFYQRTKR